MPGTYIVPVSPCAVNVTRRGDNQGRHGGVTTRGDKNASLKKGGTTHAFAWASGIGILSLLRADMPVIMCAGFSYVVEADKAKAAGIKTLAMKPLTKREIAKTIRKVLDG